MPSYDKLASRFVLILQKLNNGESFNIQDLAKECGVSVRTLQRDINERLAFMPIKNEGGLYSLEGFALGRLSFKDIQNFALLSGINALYPKLDSNFIVDLLSSKVKDIFMVKNQGFEAVSYERFEELGAAILSRQKLAFEYKGKARHIEPYKLLNNNGIWYLLGAENGKLKHFALAKIENLKELKEYFEPETALLEQIKTSKAAWLGELKSVVLAVETSARDYFMRKSFLSSYTLFEDFEALCEGLDSRTCADLNASELENLNASSLNSNLNANLKESLNLALKKANSSVLKQPERYFFVLTSYAYEDEILNLTKLFVPYIHILAPLSLKDRLKTELENYLKEF